MLEKDAIMLNSMHRRYGVERVPETGYRVVKDDAEYVWEC